MAVLRSSFRPEEPGAAQRVAVRTCTRVRSTVLVTSIQALREAGYEAAYTALVAPALREHLFGLGAPAWLPIELADAHYRACDGLGLRNEEIMAIGARLAPAHASGATIVAQAARATGMVTPWTVLAHAPRYWARMYDGAEVTVHEDGPKDARVEVAGQPLARYGYWRVGFAGVLRGLAEALASRAHVKERLSGTPDAPIVSVSIAWA
jgi:hypothetical protein